jgi:hypothetical protein
MVSVAKSNLYPRVKKKIWGKWEREKEEKKKTYLANQLI